MDDESSTPKKGFLGATSGNWGAAIAVGLALGVAFGVALDDVGIGIALGAAFAMAFAPMMGDIRRRREENGRDDVP